MRHRVQNIPGIKYQCKPEGKDLLKDSGRLEFGYAAVSKLRRVKHLYYKILQEFNITLELA